MVKARRDALELASEVHALEAREGEKRTLRLSLPMNLNRVTLISQIMTYEDRHPDVRVEISADSGLPALITGKTDVSLGSYYRPDPRLFALPAGICYSFIMATKKYERKYGLPETIEDLKRHTILLRYTQNLGYSNKLENGTDTYYIDRGHRVQHGDAAACREMLLAGEGLAIDLTPGFVSDYLASGFVFPVLKGWHREPWLYHVYCRAGSQDDKVLRELMAYVERGASRPSRTSGSSGTGSLGFRCPKVSYPNQNRKKPRYFLLTRVSFRSIQRETLGITRFLTFHNTTRKEPKNMSDNGSWELSADELSLAANRPLITELAGLGVVRASGKDAVDLLDKLFCVRVTGLGDAMKLAGWAEVKGRLLATPRIVMENEESVLLVVPRETLPEFVKRISIYIFRSKVKFEDVSDTVKVAGVMGSNDDLKAALKAALAPAGLDVPPCLWTTARANGAIAGRMIPTEEPVPGFETPAERLLVLGSADQIAALSGTRVPEAFWWLAEISAGVPTVFTSSMSKFVPQAINYDTLGGVTYNKGCYPGQEVISRVHNNMAKFGKTMVFAKTEGNVPAAGSDFTFEEKLGIVVESVKAAGTTYFLFQTTK